MAPQEEFRFRGWVKRSFKKHKFSLFTALTCLKHLFEIQLVVWNDGLKTVEETVMPWNRPVVARLLTTVMFASVIGGLLLSSQRDLRVEPLKVQASQATPASREMMRVLRDEHDLVADMVNAQLAASDSTYDSKPIAATARRQAIAMR